MSSSYQLIYPKISNKEYTGSLHKCAKKFHKIIKDSRANCEKFTILNVHTRETHTYGSKKTQYGGAQTGINEMLPLQSTPQNMPQQNKQVFNQQVTTSTNNIQIQQPVVPPSTVLIAQQPISASLNNALALQQNKQVIAPPNIQPSPVLIVQPPAQLNQQLTENNKNIQESILRRLDVLEKKAAKRDAKEQEQKQKEKKHSGICCPPEKSQQFCPIQ